MLLCRKSFGQLRVFPCVNFHRRPNFQMKKIRVSIYWPIFNLKIGESLCQKQATFAALDRHVYQSEDDVTLAEGFLWEYIQRSRMDQFKSGNSSCYENDNKYPCFFVPEPDSRGARKTAKSPTLCLTVTKPQAHDVEHGSSLVYARGYRNDLAKM